MKDAKIIEPGRVSIGLDESDGEIKVLIENFNVQADNFQQLQKEALRWAIYALSKELDTLL